jgi:hypothetical protein
MRTEQEIRKCLDQLKDEMLKAGPFTEFEIIAKKASKQTFEWVLEQTDNPLTC